MAIEKIVPPFKVDEYIDGESYSYVCIQDAKQKPIVLIALMEPYTDQDEAFANALCTVMNENHKRLCHAANGDGEASNENTKEEK